MDWTLEYLGQEFHQLQFDLSEYDLGERKSNANLANLDGREVLVWYFEEGILVGTGANEKKKLTAVVHRWVDIPTTYYGVARQDTHDYEFGSVSSLWSWTLNLVDFEHRQLTLTAAMSSGKHEAKDYINSWQEMSKILQSETRGESAIVRKIENLDWIYEKVSMAQYQKLATKLETGDILNFGNIAISSEGLGLKDKSLFPWSEVQRLYVSMNLEPRGKLVSLLNPRPTHVNKQLYLFLKAGPANDVSTKCLPAKDLPNWGAIFQIAKSRLPTPEPN